LFTLFVCCGPKPDSDRIISGLMPTLGVYLLVAAIASFVVLAVVESVSLLAFLELFLRLRLSLIAANST